MRNASDFQRFEPSEVYLRWGIEFTLDDFVACLPGVVEMLRGNRKVVEGDDRTGYHGAKRPFFVSDGKTKQKMLADGTLQEEFMSPFERVPKTMAGAKGFMEKHPGDGACFVDDHNTGNEAYLEMAHLMGLYPSGEDAVKIFSNIPADFIHFGQKTPVNRESLYKPGTKTIAASAITRRYGREGVRTFVVKGTPYGPLLANTGCGFGEDGGLAQRLFFMPDPRQKDFAISPEYFGMKPNSKNPEDIARLAVLAQTVPVYQTFSNHGQNLESQSMLTVDPDGKIWHAPYEIARPSVMPKLPPTNKLFTRTCGGLLSEGEILGGILSGKPGLDHSSYPPTWDCCHY